MTRDEHLTRAMLLGMVFVPSINCYRKLSPSTARASEYLDADTMEPVDGIEMLKRISPTLKDDPEPIPEGAGDVVLEVVEMILDYRRE